MTPYQHLRDELQSRGRKAQEDVSAFEQAQVRVALIGESGAGKSSLINAIVGSKVAETGGAAETTKHVQAVPHKEIDGLIFVDLPGCGTPSHPRETYIERQGLLQNYDVFILVTDRRIRQGDEFLYSELRKKGGKPFFVVRSHFDVLMDEMDEDEARRKVTTDIRTQLVAGGELLPYMVALKGQRSYDLGRLIEDIVNSLSGWKKDKAVMAVAVLNEGILKKKRESAERLVSRYALISAANALNPVPGLDVAVDVGVLATMAGHVISAYGFREDQLDYLARQKLTEAAMKAVREIAQPLTEYLLEQGIMLIMKRAGKTALAKYVTKWLPFVGQVVGAALGFKLTSWFGENLIADCEKAAREVTRIVQNGRPGEPG